jgi:choline dehydrogenase-like flavoprotein
MPNLPKRDVYDVCIVGSGAGGSMAAYVLAQAGAKVALLEAGPMFYSESDGFMFRWNYESPRRGRSTSTKPFGEFDACLGGWDIDGEPYTTAEGTEWRWFRARNLGGRTHHWGRISLRFGPLDFKRNSLDGLGDDWPIGYDDLKPYYDRIDQLIGIFGSVEGIENEPDGIFLPPPRPRSHELLIQRTCERMGIPVIPSRLSILTRPHNGRPACHYCSQCGRGCATMSNFSAPSVLLRPALETGNLTIIPHAMARTVTTDANGLASGVAYINTQDYQEQHVQARIVVLAASACESARLLLNSKSSHHPDGLANGSGVVGHYLTDSTGTDVMGLIPQLMNLPPANEDGVGGMHIYIPWWREGDAKLEFARGYHIEAWGGRGMPGYGFGWDIHRSNHLFQTGRTKGGGGYGQALKEDYRRLYGAYVGFSGRGEMVARKENYCEIDPHTVDKYGIPVLRFNIRWSEQEYQQVKHMQETFREVIRAMGGEPLDEMPTREQGYGITPPGWIIHEVGTTRMGSDPRASVLNAHCQAHEVKNLFVADAGPFVSQAHKNPTWTILALAWRTADYIVDQRRKRLL